MFSAQLIKLNYPRIENTDLPPPCWVCNYIVIDLDYDIRFIIAFTTVYFFPL